MAKNVKKVPENKETNDMPEISYQQEVKKSSFQLTLKEIESSELKIYISELKQKIESLEKEKSDNSNTIAYLYKNEKIIKELKEKLSTYESNKQAFDEEMKSKEKAFTDEINIIKKNYEDQISNFKFNIENMSNKIENLSVLERVNEAQKLKIQELEDQFFTNAQKAEDKFNKIKLKHGIKFSDLKKKMIYHIEDTQKNVEQLNISHMDVSTKLALLQNHQLLIELEYQSQQVEELTKKNENLEKRIFEIQRDNEIHKQVEFVLAEKNRRYLNSIKNLKSEQESSILYSNSNNLNILEDHNIHSPLNKKIQIGHSINVSYNSVETTPNLKVFNNNMKEFMIVTNLERKIHKLEKELERKKMDFNIIKDNYEILCERITNHEKKYLGIFNLFQEGLDKLINDEDLNSIKEVEVNLSAIKNADFSTISPDLRMSILMIFIKYLLPIVNPDDLALKNSNKINKLHQIQIKVNSAKMIKSKDNKNYPSYKNVTNNEPILNSSRGSRIDLPKIKRNIDKRFQIPKIASVLI